MFLGHFAIGFGAKKIEPEISLAILFIAVQFSDLLWPTLLLLNIEHATIYPELGNAKSIAFTDYPISHSLLFTILWSSLFGGLYWFSKKDLKGSIVLAICVLSHWMLDLIVHFRDLPLFPGKSPLVGLGLWSSPLGTLFIEVGIFIIGVFFYLKTTVAKNNIGKIVLWILIILLIVMHVSSIFSAAPKSITILAWSAQAQWIFIILAYWADKNRRVKSYGS